MHGRLLAVALAATAVAGCINVNDNLPPLSPGESVLVQGPDGPVPFAAVTALGAAGAPLAAFSTDAAGRFDPALLPRASRDVLVAAPGFAAMRVAAAGLPATIALAAATGAILAEDATPALRFLAPVDLGTMHLATEETCLPSNVRNTCGLSEPVIEVAGDGSIYVSGTCCVGKAPSVDVSRDGGATFQPLTTPGTREATGIEGDFAIDDAGNVYFSDILLGAVWFTSWDATGAHRHSTPFPLKPLVDRPWVRAGAEDVVYFLYNTGTTTSFHLSTDGARTFDPVPAKEFPFPLGTLGQGPANEDLVVVGGSPLGASLSSDGGATWADPELIPVPKDGSLQSFAPVVVDETGNVYATFTWGDADRGVDVFVSRRGADGEWAGPFRVSPMGVHANALPWLAAGRDGHVAVAWYGVPGATGDSESVPADAEWFLFTAASVDATAAEPRWQSQVADPLPVLAGPMARRLLDFLQVDIGPEGAAHVAYAALRDHPGAERTYYVRSTVGLALGPEGAYPSGPGGTGG